MVKKKLPPTKDAFAKNELRKAFKRWGPKNQCKILARVSRGNYQCAQCQELFKEKECEVDHKSPVVPLDIAGKDQPMQDYVDRLFVEVEDLACLCRTCHKSKSSIEAGIRKINRAKRKENEEK